MIDAFKDPMMIILVIAAIISLTMALAFGNMFAFERNDSQESTKKSNGLKGSPLFVRFWPSPPLLHPTTTQKKSNSENYRWGRERRHHQTAGISKKLLYSRA